MVRNILKASADASRTFQSLAAAQHLLRALVADSARLAARLAPFRRLLTPLFIVSLTVALFGALALALAMLWALYGVPLEGAAEAPPTSVLVEAADGQPLGRVGPLADAVPRSEFPQQLVDAVLSIEDRRFYDHWGIDPRGILRATQANLSVGAVAEGGSTITQQLAKVEIVGNERNFYRKFREALIAIWLDFRLSKDEILSRYLNRVYLGGGARGMSAAARLYFDKRLQDLTLAEVAMLAGLIQAPSRYNPLANLDAARRRAALVIEAMVETHAIDKRAAERALADPAVAKPTRRTAPAGSWFAEWIARDELSKVAGACVAPDAGANHARSGAAEGRPGDRRALPESG